MTVTEGRDDEMMSATEEVDLVIILARTPLKDTVKVAEVRETHHGTREAARKGGGRTASATIPLAILTSMTVVTRRVIAISDPIHGIVVVK